jgi:hypothetical protein
VISPAASKEDQNKTLSFLGRFPGAHDICFNRMGGCSRTTLQTCHGSPMAERFYPHEIFPDGALEFLAGGNCQESWRVEGVSLVRARGGYRKEGCRLDRGVKIILAYFGNRRREAVQEYGEFTARRSRNQKSVLKCT